MADTPKTDPKKPQTPDPKAKPAPEKSDAPKTAGQRFPVMK